MSSIRKKMLLLTGLSGACFSLLTFGAASFILGGKRQTLTEALEWQSDHYDTSWYTGLKKTSYLVKGYKGYELHVELCENPDPVPDAEPAPEDAVYHEKPGDIPEKKEKYVIITHGHTDNRIGMLKYMKIYLDRGYKCIIWDIRGHGENRKAPCTFSVLEAKDLYALIEDTYRRYGSDILLGLHGESLGAATTVAVLQYHPNVAFAVPDCPFADITNVLEGIYRYRHLPVKLLKAVSFAAKLRCGYSFSQMRPIDALASSTVPLLLIHGADDKYVPPENSIRLRDAAKGYVELHLIPGATHANSVLKDPEGYREIVNRFLDSLGC